MPDPPKWTDFFEATKGREPRENLGRALKHVGADGHALDMGCGVGNDTLAMLQHGLRVTAFDSHADAIRHTTELATEHGFSDRLQTHVASFETFEFQPAAFDLIYAGFALPFCAPDRFPEVWRDIRLALRPGGLIALQMFGDRDEWAGGHHEQQINTHTLDEIRALLDGLEEVYFEEVEEDGTTALDRDKHWHVFHIVMKHPA